MHRPEAMAAAPGPGASRPRTPAGYFGKEEGAGGGVAGGERPLPVRGCVGWGRRHVAA